MSPNDNCFAWVDAQQSAIISRDALANPKCWLIDREKYIEAIDREVVCRQAEYEARTKDERVKLLRQILEGCRLR